MHAVRALSHSTLAPSPERCFSKARKPAAAAARRKLPAGKDTGWINTFVDRWALLPSGQHAVLHPLVSEPHLSRPGREHQQVPSHGYDWKTWTPGPDRGVVLPVRERMDADASAGTQPGVGCVRCAWQDARSFRLTRKTARMHAGCAFACLVAQERASHGAALVARDWRGEICRGGRGGRRREQGA